MGKVEKGKCGEEKKNEEMYGKMQKVIKRKGEIIKMDE